MTIFTTTTKKYLEDSVRVGFLIQLEEQEKYVYLGEGCVRSGKRCEIELKLYVEIIEGSQRFLLCSLTKDYAEDV